MTKKSLRPPNAYYLFTARMIQDLGRFETEARPIDFGLNGIPALAMGDFTRHLRTVLSNETSDREHQEPWRHTNANFLITGSGLRAFLIRALERTERRESDNSFKRLDCR